jgi:antitoxin PrlF
VRITSKGQVTIPIELRERAGLLPGTEVEFALRGEAVVLTRAKGRDGRGRALVKRMRGRATSSLSTEEIMRLTRA